MTDSLRRYLRQQVELGGAELVLREPGATPATRAAASREAGPAAKVDGSAWREGAPPIPGDGIRVEPPPALPAAVAALDSLEALGNMVRQCGLCPLGRTRTNAVPGEGDPEADLMLVGEGPGQTEDETGRPFVGRAGELLDRILLSIDLPRESVYIANIVKCRPPRNRNPLPEEASTCLAYLHRQVALVRPKVLVALGSVAARHLLSINTSLGKLRGKVHHYGAIPLVVTYHPAALLRNPHWKKPTWDDVRIARQLLEA